MPHPLPRWFGLAVVAVVAGSLGLAGCTSSATPPSGVAQSVATSTPSVRPTDQAVIRASQGQPPTSITLPDLRLTSKVDPVGAPDRVLDIPANPEVVGWWRDGVGVGASEGTVVLAVHLDSRRYGTGPYAAVEGLTTGAPMTLRDGQGRSRSFTVTSVDRYRKTALPYERIFRQKGASRVVLVTCGGEYNAAAGGWDSNVVVTFRPADAP